MDALTERDWLSLTYTLTGALNTVLAAIISFYEKPKNS